MIVPRVEEEDSFVHHEITKPNWPPPLSDTTATDQKLTSLFFSKASPNPNQHTVTYLFADGGDLGGRLLDALRDKVDDLLAGHGVPDAVAGQHHEGVRRRVYPQRAHVRRGGDHLLRQGERLVLLVRVVA